MKRIFPAALLLVTMTACSTAQTEASPTSTTQSSSTSAADTYVQLARTIDGDTIETATGARIRILGLDAPETKACYGSKATDALNVLLGREGATIGTAADPAQGDKDRYGRSLRYVTTPDGRDVTEEMIRWGMARNYDEYPVARSPVYEQAQAEAKAASRGGWANCGW